MRGSREVRDELYAVQTRTVELEHELRETEECERSSIDRGILNCCQGTWRASASVLGHQLSSCSFCGGLRPDDFVWLMSQPETTYSGSDWKYGWPHKFYLTNHSLQLKFYAKHLLEANPETFEKADRLCRRYFDVEYNVKEGKLMWAASYNNIQLHGRTEALPTDFFVMPQQSYFDMETGRG